jgi:autophagy-related protein 13
MIGLIVRSLLTSVLSQFNVELDETEVLREDLLPWKTCDAEFNRPPPLIIETYIDAEELTSNQMLVILDEKGKRHQVFEHLAAAVHSSNSRRHSKLRNEVVLERWRIELGAAPREFPNDVDLGPILPTVYKKSIVLFRSLFTFSKFLPAWKLTKVSKNRQNNPLKLKYRIYAGDGSNSSSTLDTLTTPLWDGSNRVVENYNFGFTESPAGPFSVQVTYRLNCDFRVDDSEQLLSSHFISIDDEEFFRPSIPSTDDSRPAHPATGQEVGSLPVEKRENIDRPDRSQAYGSLSTFHQVGPTTGSSPLSAIRAIREPGLQSPSDSPSPRQAPNLRSAQGSRGSIRSTDGGIPVHRRPSVSFQPFKAPSLSASPSLNETPPQMSPRTSVGRASGLSQLAEARGMPPPISTQLSSQKNAPVGSENAITSSASSSPKPAPVSSRYSSSFGNRRVRLSSGGSKVEEDNNSSGKGSATSSAQPGSGVLAEAGGGSSGSIQEDDENISAFLKQLDLGKNLKSFQQPDDTSGADANTRRTSAALTRFHRMRDSNAALSDSMSSSLLLHRSSSSSSRQLSSVPPMVAGTSMSTSSSPGKPISPHTPHTPAIPSRLSANSIIAYDTRSERRHRLSHEEHDSPEGTTSEETAMDPSSGNPNAIDIPTSPRPFVPVYRRSSSAAQRGRAAAVEDEMGDLFPFGMRSASMGADDRPPLSLSALLGLQDAADQSAQPENVQDGAQPTFADPGPEMLTGPMINERSSSLEYRDYNPQTTRGGSHRPRFGRVPSGTGRGHTPTGSSITSERGSGSGLLEHRGGRYSWSRANNNQYDEEEPLLFALNDIGASRRSLEEGRGGSNAGAGGVDRGGNGDGSRRSNGKSAGH